MHLSLLAAFVTLVVIPAIATTMLWRSPVLRRHRVARWLLAPCIYIGVAAFNLFVVTNLGLAPSDIPIRPQYSVRIEDWKNHPDVKEVRMIYDEIRNGIKNNKFKSKLKKFNINSEICSSSPYPLKEKLLVSDTENRIRMYQVEQISHRTYKESFTVERYYDSSGMLRFVFVDRNSSNVRIYLNSVGKIVWSVDQYNNTFTVGDTGDEDWEVTPKSADDAKMEFMEQESCPPSMSSNPTFKRDALKRAP